MAEQKESSVLFSLKELMNLEEDRIRQEEMEKRRQEEAAVQARLDAERRAREEEEARMRSADEERRMQESRQREEAARLEAIRHAEIEKARLEAENAARMEQIRRQQEHERQLASLNQDQGKKKLLYIAVGSGVFLLLALIFGGLAIKSSLDRQKALEAQLGALSGESEELKKKLSSATGEEREELLRQLQEKEEAMKSLKDHPDKPPPVATVKPVRTGPRQNTNTGGGTTPAKPCNCTPGDPLCSCL